jgi:hypothetical protein
MQNFDIILQLSKRFYPEQYTSLLAVCVYSFVSIYCAPRYACILHTLHFYVVIVTSSSKRSRLCYDVSLIPLLRILIMLLLESQFSK